MRKEKYVISLLLQLGLQEWIVSSLIIDQKKPLTVAGFFLIIISSDLV